MPLESRGKSRSCSIACGHEALGLPASFQRRLGPRRAAVLRARCFYLLALAYFLCVMTSLFVGLGPSNLGVLAAWNLHLWGATVMACARTKSGACDPDCRTAFDRSMRDDNCARAAQRQTACLASFAFHILSIFATSAVCLHGTGGRASCREGSNVYENAFHIWLRELRLFRFGSFSCESSRQREAPPRSFCRTFANALV